MKKILLILAVLCLGAQWAWGDDTPTMTIVT